MKYLFYISKQYSIPIIIPLVNYLKQNNGDFALFCSQKVKQVLPEDWGNITLFHDLKDAQSFQPDFVLAPGNFVDFRLPGFKVQIFHGIGVEKPVHYHIRHFFDVYLTSGPLVTEAYLKLQKKYKYFAVEETGWPKVDYIMSYPKNYELPEKPEDKKVILFAPTHSSKMQSAEELLPYLSKTIKADEIWYVKFHELMNRELVKMCKEIPNLHMIQSYDITPYLHLADLLISDTSSVVYEFMLLNKPVITYNTIARDDKGINIHQPEELRAALDRCLNTPAEFEQNRRRHILEVNPNLDGTISRDLFETLERIYPTLPLRRKPLNLFRKLQILYHSQFKKGYLR